MDIGVVVFKLSCWVDIGVVVFKLSCWVDIGVVVFNCLVVWILVSLFLTVLLGGYWCRCF